jgi:hypothetical protein
MSSAPIRKITGGSLGSESNATDANLPFDMSTLNPEVIENIQRIIESANSLMSEEEREHKRIQQKKQMEFEQKLTDAVEKESAKEMFEIPKGSSKLYKFIGYSTDEFEEIMTIGNQADNLPAEEKGSATHLKLQTQVWKKTIKYSLENIPDEVLNKLPKRDLQWLWMVIKEKNDNPLPFDLNV